ncbi:hypothetical protein N9937_00710 [bacterium]|nr:hypothetical protein [bacterium]
MSQDDKCQCGHGVEWHSESDKFCIGEHGCPCTEYTPTQSQDDKLREEVEEAATEFLEYVLMKRPAHNLLLAAEVKKLKVSGFSDAIMSILKREVKAARQEVWAEAVLIVEGVEPAHPTIEMPGRCADALRKAAVGEA